ncbi:O-FucT domain-containing protein [Cucumis melo var. makuwa]|uniref:O-fucosyltransferase family protein n=1 Tax=Cucumis melo var. makuwa TaxID=1194695 RepID=A0A5D3BJR3_CUCMM|nr:O-FucT domain-containing protein [Cucumis melo var. makuwa]
MTHRVAETMKHSTMARPRNIRSSFSSLNPPPFFDLLSLTILASFFSPKKIPRTLNPYLSLFFLSLLTSLAFLGISTINFLYSSPFYADSCSPKSPISFSSTSSSSQSRLLLSLLSPVASSTHQELPKLSTSVMIPLPAHGVSSNLSNEETEFWKQPDGEGYRPCLDFSFEYRKASAKISKENRRFLMVMVSGGLNQQRNQIADAVVIARILEAALIVPILKKTLRADVRVVSSLPFKHFKSKETKIPHDVSPHWIRSRFLTQLNKERLLVLNGLDSKLSKNLSFDLQKLKCKVAFHALKFAAAIQELGNQLTRRMWIEGPYIAIHLRLEKDVWVRSGCRTGLDSDYDAIIAKIRNSQPEYLTGRINMSHIQRRRAGLCPLNALEIARLLKALGAPKQARIYTAGGEPFGGKKALQPLIAEFPNIVTKYTLSREGELSPFINKSSAMAAIDYIVSLSSDVFMPSHGGNMGRAMQGHRAYVGHRKYIKPNKRAMLEYFDDASISETELGTIVRKLHKGCMGQPEPRTKRKDRDIIAYPMPECMCQS